MISIVEFETIYSLILTVKYAIPFFHAINVTIDPDKVKI